MLRRPSTKVFGTTLFVMALGFAACGGGDDAETHPLGETVQVGVVSYDESGARDAETTAGVTPLAVRDGTLEELEEGGFNLDPEDESKRVYYVDARYENTGQETIVRNLSVNLEDPDGNLINGTTVIDLGGEPFEHCEEAETENFAPGDTYESCTLFLVPEGVEIDKISFLSDNGASEEPEFIYWDIE